MRNLLALIGLLVVGFGGIGWYCGWYKLSVGKGLDGNLQIETEVKTKKVVEDSSSFFQKVGKIASDKLEKDGKDSQPVSAPVATPGPSAPAAPTPPAAPAPPVPSDRGGFANWLLAPQKPAQPTAGNR
ncbi:unnamed protein product [Gemmataceae bacterium]|nr:unnamed protein product [Gemmataceae bacterium]VTU02350.1 unnamed protein product [Gemmataceae bacterium]